MGIGERRCHILWPYGVWFRRVSQIIARHSGFEFEFASDDLAKPQNMSHSTTGTSSYILTKYSRSYPVKRTLQKAQIGSQSGPEIAQEWQHFTNPTIRLVLDVKTSSIGEMESVRLRIIWQLDAGFNQPDVSFASFLLCAIILSSCSWS